MEFNQIRGGDEGLRRIKYLLDNNPKKHMYEVTSENHMVNKANSFGIRPLYLACLHGHLEVSFADC
jgi:hypothetical protein